MSIVCLNSRYIIDNKNILKIRWQFNIAITQRTDQ